MDIGFDVALEIILNLDAVSTGHFLTTTKLLYSFSKHQSLQNRITPYQQHIRYQQWNFGLMESVRRNNVPQINFFLDRGADDYSKALQVASYEGLTYLVHFFIGLSRTEVFSKYSFQAARGGHNHLVDFFISRASLQLFKSFHRKEALKGASIAGHVDMVHELVEKVGADAPEYLSSAAEGGHKHILEIIDTLPYPKRVEKAWCSAFCKSVAAGNIKLAEYCWEKTGKSVTLLEQAVLEAIQNSNYDTLRWVLGVGGILPDCRMWVIGGDTPMIEFLIEQGAIGWDEALANWAAVKGDVALLSYCFEKGATLKLLDRAVMNAIESDHREAIYCLIEKGFNDWNLALKQAARRGHRRLAEIFIERGATELDKALEAARDSGFSKLAAFLKQIISEEPIESQEPTT